ncbi:MAG: permease-like cell division protein FtsX, partial [Myxococcales bacterium]|nr:permease-like cell division protein FtsX [Myxococcales bacterium]
MSAGVSVDAVRLAGRDAWRMLRRAPIGSGAAVLAIGLALALVSIYMFVASNTSRVLDAAARDLSVTLYLGPEATEADAAAVVEAAKGSALVDHVEFRTTAQEKARVVGLLGEDLLEGVDEEAIPAQPTIEVRFVASELSEARFASMQELVEKLRAAPGVAEGRFEATHVGIIFAFGDLATATGLAVGLIAFIVALVFVSFMVRLGLDARTDEIAKLRTFGATDRFVYAPVAVAALAVGAAGGVVGVALCVLVDHHLAVLASRSPAFAIELDFVGGGLIATCLVGGL